MQKDVYVDLLCWNSAFKVVFSLRNARPGKIYYVNASRLFVPFIGFLQKTLKRPVVQIADISFGEEKIDGISLYEATHMRIEALLGEWVKQEAMAKFRCV